jgi:polysaccharide biosynthesis transport protein
MNVQSSTLRDYLQVLRRRRWIVILALVAAPAGAMAASMLQQPRYAASAEVLLSRQNLANSLNNVTDPTLSIDPQRLVDTQTNVAQSPQIAAGVIAAAHLQKTTPDEFLGSSSVTARTGTDVLVFRVTDRHPLTASTLATLYARQYLVFANQLSTQAIRAARREVDAKIAGLEAAGQTGGALYADLLAKDQQLATMEVLQTGNATLIRPADTASQVQPTPVRDGLIGLLVGLMLGLGLAFLRDHLDTRVRSAAEVSDRLGLPLLARVPEPPRNLRRSNRLVMLDEPTSPAAEPFRVLVTNLEFVSHELEPKTIMVTSACPGEGKSTTAANLAVTLARTGKRVALVDLDLRRPFVHELFHVPSEPGLTTMALGQVTLEDAVVSFPVGGVPAGGNGIADTGPENRLQVLCSGRMPPNPGEFIRSRGVGRLILHLSEVFDTVIIDSAPLLGLGDSLALIPRVDAVVLVARLELLRRQTVDELKRVLDGSGASALGIVVTAAHSDGEGESYGYDYGANGRSEAKTAKAAKDVNGVARLPVLEASERGRS